MHLLNIGLQQALAHSGRLSATHACVLRAIAQVIVRPIAVACWRSSHWYFYDWMGNFWASVNTLSLGFVVGAAVAIEYWSMEFSDFVADVQRTRCEAHFLWRWRHLRRAKHCFIVACFDLSIRQRNLAHVVSMWAVAKAHRSYQLRTLWD